MGTTVPHLYLAFAVTWGPLDLITINSRSSQLFIFGIYKGYGKKIIYFLFLRQRWEFHFPRVIILVVFLKGSTGPQSTEGPHPYHNNESSTNFTSVTLCQIYAYVIYWDLEEPNHRKWAKKEENPSQRGVCSVLWDSVLRGTDQTHTPTLSLISTDFVCCVRFVFLRKIKKCKS